MCAPASGWCQMCHQSREERKRNERILKISKNHWVQMGSQMEKNQRAGCFLKGGKGKKRKQQGGAPSKACGVMDVGRQNEREDSLMIVDRMFI